MTLTAASGGLSIGAQCRASEVQYNRGWLPSRWPPGLGRRGGHAIPGDAIHASGTRYHEVDAQVVGVEGYRTGVCHPR